MARRRRRRPRPGARTRNELGVARILDRHARRDRGGHPQARVAAPAGAAKPRSPSSIREGSKSLEATRDAFAARLRSGNHTLKRALTDPHLLSGVGNAYSDEILHAARLSPFKQTQKITEEEMDRLHAATRATLLAWTDRLRAETGDGFPVRVTAFRPEMAVHGRYREPCPVCGAPVQRIAYADNEANYCARCQTDGKLLADRALSRLLHDDWPKTLDEMEERRPAQARGAGAQRAEGERSPSRRRAVRRTHR